MKRKFQSLMALSAALVGASTGAQAQEINTSLPLTSIGDRLMWEVADQNLTLNVPVAGQVQLELYSPRVDPRDYRSDTYFGDETYSAEPVSTKFTLLREDGSVVTTQTFTPGEQSWETLFNLNLPAGNYKVLAETAGNGKNTFAVRLTGVSADLSAERLAVNVHASDWTPVLNVSVDGAGYALRMYDGDGPQELEARLRDAAGNVYPLAVSGDLAWSDLPLPEQAGKYTVELRQPKTAKQFSNTVSFSLARQGNQTPISISRVDQTGLLRVTAELVLPTGNVPTNVNVLVGSEHLQVNGQTEKTVPAGSYPLSVTDIPGATVSADRQNITVEKGGVGEAKVQVKPEVALTLTSDKQEVCVGDTVTLTARASTAYAGALPLDLNIEAAGLTLSGDTNLKGELSAAKPGELRLTGTATQAGPLTATARLAPWSAAQTVNVNVRPDATSLQLTRAALDDAKIGDEITVRLTVKNTASQAMPFTLKDEPGTGLQALGDTTFSGTLAAGEERELSYKAKVTASTAQVGLKAQLDSPACPAPQTVQGNLNVAPRPAPAALRQSTITLPFDAPRQTQTLTIAHTLPAGATLVPGSSKLDGKPVADPKRAPSGTLYWVVPAPTGNKTEEGAALRGNLTYDVNHTEALGALPKPTLSVVLPGNRTEVLEGQLNLQDLQAATDLKAGQNTLAENDGAIKLPLADSTIRVRDRISVTVEAPQGDIPPLTVNGKVVPNTMIGTNTQDGTRGIQRLTYVAVPLEAGRNVLKFLDQEISVYLVGATSRIAITPLDTTADGSTPIRLKVQAYDAFNQLTEQPTVTVRTNLEPRTPDANSGEAGYQVKLVNGEGIFELQPQSSPTSLRLDVLQNDQVQTYRYEIRPDRNSVGVGMISATVGLNTLGSNFSVQNNLTWQARAYYEGPIGQGKLYVAADKDKLPTDEKTLIRYPAYGDASTESVPLQGIDPVALTYDHPGFRADYRRNTLPIDVFSVGEQLTALTVTSKTDPQLSGFVALVPRDLVKGVRLTPNGTRVLHLNPAGEISDGSDALKVVTLERNTGKELKSVPLQRNVDYVIDYRSGVVTLSRALDRVDLELNERVVVADYRLDNPLAKRDLAYGVQLKKTGKNYTIGAAAVSLDKIVTFGARATYDNGTTRADGLVAYSSGLQVSATVDSKPNDRQEFRAKLRYQQPGYAGLGKQSDGLSVDGHYAVKITDRLQAVLDAEYHRNPTSSADPVNGITKQDTTQGGSVTARADYKIDPFSVGLGAKYAFGDQHGFGVVGSVGYHNGNTNVDVIHTQPISGNLKPTTDITTKFRVARNVNLGFTDKIEWGVGQSAALTLDTMIGNVNYAAGYELPTASGAGNRARFSVGTTLPLGKNLALGVRGSALYNIATRQGELGAGADLNYKTDTVSATIGSDVSYKSDLGFGVVLRGGITGSVTDHLTLTADGLMELGQDKNGQRFSLGYAYRARTLASLGYVRYVNGTLAGQNPELSSGFSAEYRQPTWAVRAGADTRTLLKDKDSFTWQASVGGTAYLGSRFGLGAWARMTGQPASGYQAFGYGVEGSVLTLPGTWLTAGYNFKGFEGLPSAGTYTRQGAYLRLDLTLDETLGGKK